MSENAEKIKSEKMEKMEALRKQLADLEQEPAVSSSDEDAEVQRVSRCAPRRERTEKQKEAFVKAQATRLAKAEERKKEKALKEQEEREQLEQKLIEKAIKVKKKQIKKMAVIEQLSDDDTPIEKLRPAIKKTVQLPKPKMMFV
jgi:hypothetical protein